MGMFTELVGKKVFDFETIVNQELSKLAEIRGDTLLGFGVKEYALNRVCDYRNFNFSCGHNQDVRVVHYRKNGYRCQQCLGEKIHTVAATRGLTLVNMDIVQHGCEREYIRPCGHTVVHSHNYLTKHNTGECQTCISTEVQKNVEKHSLVLIKKVRTGYLLECANCRTQLKCNTPTARSGEPVCTYCFDEKLKQEAGLVDFTYLVEKEPLRMQSEARTMLNRWYSCNKCGYVDNYGHIAVRMKNVRCDSCFNKQKVNEAYLQGMEYLGHVTKGSHLYRLPCGCSRAYPLNSVRRGVWACETHGNTHYHRESGIYLVELEHQGFSWLKFGYAKNLDIRLKGYGLPDGVKSEVLFYKITETGYSAMRLEKQIHSEVREFRIDSSFMKQYMTNTGHTECYPLEIRDLLLGKLQNIGITEEVNE
jgi:hypothetical protein